MDPSAPNTFKKDERLCGKTAIENLLKNGRWGRTEHLRYCSIPCADAPATRILVSVPKKFFKRAVKRNLLKRRIREAYRTRKELISGSPADIMFVYSSGCIAPMDSIREEVSEILSRLAK